MNFPPAAQAGRRARLGIRQHAAARKETAAEAWVGLFENIPPPESVDTSQIVDETLERVEQLLGNGQTVTRTPRGSRLKIENGRGLSLDATISRREGAVINLRRVGVRGRSTPIATMIGAKGAEEIVAALHDSYVQQQGAPGEQGDRAEPAVRGATPAEIARAATPSAVRTSGREFAAF
jgi:hypothetical protein